MAKRVHDFTGLMQHLKIDKKERIETGHLKFNDDWCGLFIRGDNAKILAFELEKLVENSKLFEHLMCKSILKLIKKLPK